MSVDLQVDQALVLKKRARRRLVGAIALVLLMIIILPQILQDRSMLTKPEPIRITMPELQNEQSALSIAPVTSHQPATESAVEVSQDVVQTESIDIPSMESVSTVKELEAKELERKKALAKSAESKAVEAESVGMKANEVKELKSKPEVNKAEPTKAEPTKAEPTKAEPTKAEPTKVAKSAEKTVTDSNVISAKPVEEKPSAKSDSTFTVQVGVYSDVANVKRLQDQLKQAGFATTTEKTVTSKGDALRLKAGKFRSRQDAMSALAKIKEIGLPGIVISND